MQVQVTETIRWSSFSCSFGPLITADQNILTEYIESRAQHCNALECAGYFLILASKGIRSYVES